MSTKSHMIKLLVSPTKYPKVVFMVTEKRFGLLSDEDKREYEIKAKVKPKKRRNAKTKRRRL